MYQQTTRIKKKLFIFFCFVSIVYINDFQLTNIEKKNLFSFCYFNIIIIIIIIWHENKKNERK